jgi:transposase InsO family protein
VEEKKMILDAWKNKTETADVFCQRQGVPKFTVYKWLKRYRQYGLKGLENRTSGPRKKSAAVKTAIIEMKQDKPGLGIRKIRDFLARLKLIKISHETVRRTLKKEGLIEHKRPKPNRPKKPRWFERSAPNMLWQMDIMTFTLKRLYQRVYLIGLIDDHSRYLVGWGLFSSQVQSNVLEVIKQAIIEHGLPQEILTDNGRQFVAWQGKSKFQKEMTHQGIQHTRSSPRHPQTLGKIESFWRNIWQEFLAATVFESFDDARKRIEAWIKYYNHQRPHQGIDGLVPADRYYRVANDVKKTIESGCTANALELARHGEPKKPFYLVGRLGEKELVIKAEGDRVEINLDGAPLEQIDLGTDKLINRVVRKEDESDDWTEEHPIGGEAGNNSEGLVGQQDHQTDMPGTQDQPEVILPVEGSGLCGNDGSHEAQETGAKTQTPRPGEGQIAAGEPAIAPGKDAGGASSVHSPENAVSSQDSNRTETERRLG